MTDDELSKTINETCDCSGKNGRYYVCSTDRQIYSVGTTDYTDGENVRPKLSNQCRQFSMKSEAPTS